MITYDVSVHPSKEDLKREDQLAWKIAGVAADKVAVDKDVVAMIVNRIIDNASVAIAASNRRPVVSARDMALARPHKGGATVFGVAAGKRVTPEWAAWANGTAVRELDMHDTFLAADYSHPGDNIPPILAVAQTTAGKSGRDLIREVSATGWAKSRSTSCGRFPLHEHKIDHIGHLCPAQAAGIGTLLGLKQEVIYQAVQQAVHVSFTTRQSRKGEISSWKALRSRRIPAIGGGGGRSGCCVAKALRHRSMKAEDSVIAWMLDGPEGGLSRAAAGRRANASARSWTDYTKEHSAGILIRSQALIPILAFRDARTRSPTSRTNRRRFVIHTSHHTHNVIGTGANDPQKMDLEGQPRNAGPLDHVYLRGGAAGRQMASRGQLHFETCWPRRHRSPLAQDRDHRGSGVDTALSLDRSE